MWTVYVTLETETIEQVIHQCNRMLEYNISYLILNREKYPSELLSISKNDGRSMYGLKEPIFKSISLPSL
jgi:hypothetical protein